MVGMDVVSRSPILKGILQGEAEAKPRPPSRKCEPWRSEGSCRSLLHHLVGHCLCWLYFEAVGELSVCSSHAEVWVRTDVVSRLIRAESLRTIYGFEDVTAGLSWCFVLTARDPYGLIAPC